MSSIVPPAADTQAQDEVISAHEFVPPCGYSAHRDYGTGPAVWAVWFRSTPCGHRNAEFLYFCDGCWSSRGRKGIVRCNTCERKLPQASTIQRVERI